MAENDDPFASIIDDCLYSSSQEELLRYSKFAREDEIFAGDTGKPPASVNSGQYPMGSAGADVVGGSNRVEVAGVRADCDEKRDLRFPQEKKSATIEVVFDGEVRVSEVQETELEKGRVRERENPEEGSSIEPPLKKSRVSGSTLKGEKVSPLVQCSEKTMIDSEDKGKQIVVFRGGVRAEIVSPLRCFAPTGVECTEELVVGDEHDATQDEMTGDKSNPAQEKLEFEDNSEVIEVHEEETNEPKNKEMVSDVDKGDGNGKGSENRQDVSSEEIQNRGKRELPRSLLGQIWGLNADGSDGPGNGSSGTHNKERGEKSVEENGGQKSKTDENLRHLLDVLKMLVTQMLCDADDNEIDIFETAKRRGMTFPCTRFRVDLKMDE